MISSKLLPIFLEKILLVEPMYRALKMRFFMCVDSFHDTLLRVALHTLKTCLLTFLNIIPGRVLGNQVIRLFLRTSFKF